MGCLVLVYYHADVGLLEMPSPIAFPDEGGSFVFVSRARTGWVDSSTAAILSGFQLVASVGSSGEGGGWLFLFAAVMVV